MAAISKIPIQGRSEIRMVKKRSSCQCSDSMIWEPRRQYLSLSPLKHLEATDPKTSGAIAMRSVLDHGRGPEFESWGRQTKNYFEWGLAT